MTRIKFSQSLNELKERLLAMAGLVEQAIQRAVEAYSARDQALCEAVVLSEQEINRMEREIDQLAVDLLAMEQPMARDLRFIIAVIRINADLERVGDQAVSIARRVRDLRSVASADLAVDVPRFGSLAAAMVRRALQAFIDEDAEMAASVHAMDDEVDDLNWAAYRTILARIREDVGVTEQALNLLIICRSLERVGDHATNIAEDVIFWVRGTDVRSESKQHLLVPDAR